MVKTAKHIRLEKGITTPTLNSLLKLYKEAKQSHDIHKILAVKSFISKAVEAQYVLEFNVGGHYHKRWVTLDEYVPNIIESKTHWPRGVKTPMEYILYIVENASPFDYKKEQDFRKTF